MAWCVALIVAAEMNEAAMHNPDCGALPGMGFLIASGTALDDDFIATWETVIGWETSGFLRGDASGGWASEQTAAGEKDAVEIGRLRMGERRGSARARMLLAATATPGKGWIGGAYSNAIQGW